MLTAAPLAELSGIRHGFFTRAGGVSEGRYASLNCGLGSGDEREAVLENRRRAAAALGARAERLVTLFQIHSPEVMQVDRPWPATERPRADALVTATPGVVLGVLTADCAPVLFADPKARVVGAAHAGWKGAIGGVTEATLDAMERLGADRRNIRAAVGPAIGAKSYEVGPEFPQPFLAQDPANAAFFEPGAGDRQLFDLKAYVARRLTLAGVGDVVLDEADTAADAQRFFSYRRTTKAGDSDYGRLLSAIVLES
jgi:YfiH family protein